jgi:hypothetical protein
MLAGGRKQLHSQWVVSAAVGSSIFLAVTAIGTTVSAVNTSRATIQFLAPVVFCLVFLLLTLWLWFGLAVVLDETGLTMRRPMHRNEFAWGDITAIEVVDAPWVMMQAGPMMPRLTLADGSNIDLWRLTGSGSTLSGKPAEVERKVEILQVWRAAYGTSRT